MRDSVTLFLARERERERRRRNELAGQEGSWRVVMGSIGCSLGWMEIYRNKQNKQNKKIQLAEKK